MVHFQELHSFIHFMYGQKMGGSLHILLLKTQLFRKGFYCPNPGLISNCKREGSTIGGRVLKLEEFLWDDIITSFFNMYPSSAPDEFLVS